jgi:hypothetical protein
MTTTGSGFNEHAEGPSQRSLMAPRAGANSAARCLPETDRQKVFALTLPCRVGDRWESGATDGKDVGACYDAANRFHGHVSDMQRFRRVINIFEIRWRSEVRRDNEVADAKRPPDRRCSSTSDKPSVSSTRAISSPCTCLKGQQSPQRSVYHACSASPAIGAIRDGKLKREEPGPIPTWGKSSNGRSLTHHASPLNLRRMIAVVPN